MLFRDAPVLIMEMKDPEAEELQGHAAAGLQTRGQRKLSALLFTHSVLTCACAALCIYTLYKVHHTEETWYNTPPPPVDRGIYLNMQLEGIMDPGPYLNFTVNWNNSLELEHGSEVIVPIAGPYIFYICALVKGNGTKGNLTLSQGQTNVSIELSAQSDRYVRHQRVISLYENEKVTFRFKNTCTQEYIYLEGLRVGLHYLLGAQDFSTPRYDASS